MNELHRLRRMYEASTKVESLYNFLHKENCPSRFAHLSNLSLDELPDAIKNLDDYNATQLYSSYKVSGVHGDRSQSIKATSTSFGTATQTADFKPDKRYLNLFAEDAKKDEWNESEWMIRLEYYSEMESAKSRGGCSGCKRAALLRKYLAKLSLPEQA